MADPQKVYVCCIDYEGGHAAYSTLEKAIEAGTADYIEEWVIDGGWDLLTEPVWSRPSDAQAGPGSPAGGGPG